MDFSPTEVYLNGKKKTEIRGNFSFTFPRNARVFTYIQRNATEFF